MTNNYSMNLKGSKPLYLQLKDKLLERILSGAYQPEEKLPSERNLSKEFKISRITVREALKALSNEGFIYAQVGKGTYVNHIHFKQDTKLTGFTEQMKKKGKEVTSKIIEFTLELANQDVMSKLELYSNNWIYKLKRIRYTNQKAVAIETAYIPEYLCKKLDEYDFSRESLYDVLRDQYGYQLVIAEQMVVASLANNSEHEIFEIEPPAAVLRMKRITRGAQKKVIEYVESVYRGDLYVLYTQLSSENL